MKNFESSSAIHHVSQEQTEVVIPYVIFSTKPYTFGNTLIDPEGRFVSSNNISAEEHKPKNIKSIIKPSIFVAGEEFLLSFEDNEIILTHPKWSLTGAGNGLHAAENNLREKAKIYFEGYRAIPINELSPEAIQFRNYILTIF